MTLYVPGYLWEVTYWYLINNVWLFHLNLEVRNYVSAAKITNPPNYLDPKYLVLFSCVVCQINLRVYEWVYSYVRFTTTLVDEILRYIQPQ